MPDTNIFVSGLLSAVGPPARIVQAVLPRRLIPIMSPATFAELATVVPRSTFQPALARAGINLTIFLAMVRAEAHSWTRKLPRQGDTSIKELPTV